MTSFDLMEHFCIYVSKFVYFVSEHQRDEDDQGLEIVDGGQGHVIAQGDLGKNSFC